MLRVIKRKAKRKITQRKLSLNVYFDCENIRTVCCTPDIHSLALGGPRLLSRAPSWLPHPRAMRSPPVSHQLFHYKISQFTICQGKFKTERLTFTERLGSAQAGVENTPRAPNTTDLQRLEWMRPI